jgi:L-threonylcarbamoyladenylate synthase
VSATSPEPFAIAEAAAVLVSGGLVAFPTETVYGLGARGLHVADVLRIFEAKQRPHGHPLILHVDGEPMATTLAASWPERASRLTRAFWPGPLTLVVPRAAHVPDAVTGGLDTVGVRAPRHPVALALVQAAGEALAAPSANAHMHVSPTTAAHVLRSLDDRVDLILDAGACTQGIESTVVDLTRDVPCVLRAGATSLEALRAVVPEIAYEADALTVAVDAARASPGLASRHYAPRTRVLLAESGAAVATAVRDAARGGRRVGVIVWSDTARAALAGLVLSSARSLPADADGYAHGLFAALHEADEASLDALVIERVPDGPAWWAIADRLRRAARSVDE